MRFSSERDGAVSKKPANLDVFEVGQPQSATYWRGYRDDRVAMTLRLTQAEYERLTLAAARRRLSKQDVMAMAVREWLDQQG